MRIVCDEILIQELRSPGADVRCGVNFISRPPQDIIRRISAIQAIVRQREPDQYFYPAADLHLTVFEIAHSLKPQEAEKIGKILQTGLGAFRDLPAFHLVLEGAAFDERAGRLKFNPVDDGFASLSASLASKVHECKITPNPRHKETSPHITFLRYLCPLQGKSWPSSSTEPGSVTWTVSELWLTWGATWFGKRSRITEAGPFILLR
jgi:2'-5' RNA ligase